MYGFRVLSLLTAIMLTQLPSAGARYYRPDDWVTYTDFRNIHSVASDLRYVYLGTDGGIVRFNRATKSWDHPLTEADGLPETPVRVVASDPTTRNLWVLTRSKLNLYDSTSDRWKSFSDMNGIPASRAEAIGIGRDYIYVRSGSKVVRSDRIRQIWEPSPAPPPRVSWYGEEPDLREHPFLAPYYVLDRRLRSYSMTSLAADGFDIWVGTAGHGLLHCNSLTLVKEEKLFGPAGEDVKALRKVDGTLWIGGDCDAITAWNQSQSAWSYFDPELSYGLLSSRVNAICADSPWIWFGTEEGLTRHSPQKGEWKTFTIFDGLWANSVTALARDGETLWIGTEDGLCRMDRKSASISRIKDTRFLRVNDLVATPTHLWVATPQGVFYFNRKKTWKRLESPEGSLGFGTNSIVSDGEMLWFGTRRRGVVGYSPKDGDWKSYAAPTHLPADLVLSLGADKRNLWVGTPSGVARLHRQKQIWTTYTTLDGLISNHIETILPDGDWVYFGTPNGLTGFWWNDPFLPK